MRLSRGQRDAALDEIAKALELSRAADNHALVMQALLRYAWALLQLGRSDEARALFAEAVPLLKRSAWTRYWLLPEVAFDLGESAVARPVLLQLPPTPGNRAMLAAVDGDFEEAARLYGEAGIAVLEAESHLRAAEQLVASGHGARGAVELEKALAFYRSVGAEFFVERGEALLAEAQSASA